MSNRVLNAAIASVVSIGLFASAAAQAQTICTSAGDEAAFQVGALKSELTVLAIGCRNEDAYNSFVERYRSELVAKDGVVNAWFKRNYGGGAQRNYDQYITLLANEHAQLAQQEGTDYCPRLMIMFNEVMALPNPAVLDEYAEVKDVVPAGVGACQGPSSAPASRPPVRTAAAKKR
jgi:hypothetical protein